MTNLKDKLSANVRRAKATQQPEPDTPAAAKPAAAKPAAARPATAKPAAKPAPAATANVVQESGTSLFPSRVWPD